MKRRLHLIGLESLESRYTKEWKTHLPNIFGDDFEVIDEYYGDTLPTQPGKSDFLSWVGTNYFKSSQMMKISEALSNGKIDNDDIFLFADFWNPTVIQLVYMLKMLKLNCKIVGLAHAGMYDPFDRLAEIDWFGGNQSHKIRKRLYESEISIINCYDCIYFATKFHLSLFERTYPLENGNFKKYVCDTLTEVEVVGFPFEYIRDFKSDIKNKKNQILFTQRNAPEKQPHLFDNLKLLSQTIPELSHCEFININEFDNVDKTMYHKLLSESKCVISFALQETLGITPYEALAFGCDVLVPDRLSYTEMYMPEFKYDSSGFGLVPKLIDKIINFDANYNIRAQQRSLLDNDYFSCGKLIEHLKGL